jgi:hypothetical protein
MRRLSPDQQHILLHIYRRCQEAHQAAGAHDAPIWWRVAGNRSEQASASRSLRRLEARGLVQRVHHRAAGPGREPPEHVRFRTTHVCLTRDGRDMAQRLTAPGVGGC